MKPSERLLQLYDAAKTRCSQEEEEAFLCFEAVMDYLDEQERSQRSERLRSKKRTKRALHE